MARLPDPAVRRRWKQRFREFERSGLTVVEFCQQLDVSTASFYLWKRKLRDADNDTDPSASPGRFVPVTVDHEVPREDCFRIRFAGNVIIEVPARESETLLRAVERLAATCYGPN